MAVIGVFADHALATTTATLSGIVKDSSGAVVQGATVTATNVESGIKQMQHSNDEGYYIFQSLSPGRYDVAVLKAGFKVYQQTGLVLHLGTAPVVDVTLQVGDIKEILEVSSGSIDIEAGSPEMGEAFETQTITTVPLLSRSYTDLLTLQPGVAPTSSQVTGAYGGPFQSVSFVLPLVSGDLSSGALSINGQREASSGFFLNGISVQESGFGGTNAIPNLDSIAEFLVHTNNDAKYGNSGGQVDVITKSGTNRLHGDVFDFLRNTGLDARGFFDPLRGAYHQNQFGGTLGGPIKHDKLFFFADYQGNRKIQGLTTPPNNVPSSSEQGGDFSQIVDQNGQSLMTGIVHGALWAQQLSAELGYNVSPEEPYFIPGCTKANCVFPNADIPRSAFSTPAQNLLKYIPSPNLGASFFSTQFPMRLSDNKTSGRVDTSTDHNTLSAYYFFDGYTLTDPYPTANVPGFEATSTGRTQVAEFGDTWIHGSTTVNEAHIGFARSSNSLNRPVGGTGLTLDSLGFTTGGNGIVPLAPNIEGVPEIDFLNLGLTIGVPSRPLRLIENTFQLLDNFNKVTGRHALQFGGNFHYNQLVEQLQNTPNGNFLFFGAETGIDFADFLIGAPTFYAQGQALPFNGRSRYLGLYAQDSWRAHSNLTLNYGLRWDVSTPWWEQHNELETIVPGLQSRVFPGSPRGWVFPGDPGIPSTAAPTRYNNFAPRIGIVYAPATHRGQLGRLLGRPGQTSVRAGYGVFFTPFEGATNFNIIADAPYGLAYLGTAPTFTTPFVNRGDGVVVGQRFPAVFPPPNVSATNPDNSVNWANFTPITSSPGFYYKNRLPYSENYDLSLQREFSETTRLTISYVGAQGHRLLVTQESNPGNPQLCLATPGCGPFLESNFNTRLPIFGPLFQSNGYFITLGQSSYNSLQLDLRHTSGRSQLLAGYTYSKSLDNSSGYGEQINPFNPKAGIALSAFDATHNFVFSYNYTLPVDTVAGAHRLTKGWVLSGITRFSTGLPVTLIETDDNSLLGTQFSGPIQLGIDLPNYGGGPLHFYDPRSGQTYFDTSGFTPEKLGQLGNARRRFFHGPGINNWDLAIMKNTNLTERSSVQFRAEFFNVFNHTQFLEVNGNVNDLAFGQAQSVQQPRIGQISLKLSF
jgi:hypothetical protein